MAENKKSVLLYCDIILTVNKLTDEEAGRLFKHYLMYINDMQPETNDRLIDLLFEPIKQQLKRDLKVWESKCERNKEIAIASWEKRKDTNASKRIRTHTKNADTDNDTDKKNNIDIRKLKFADTLKPFVEKYGKEMIRKFYDYWVEPNKSNTKFKQELQKTWDTNRRLESWNSNNFDAKKPQQTYNHDNSGLI